MSDYENAKSAKVGDVCRWKEAPADALCQVNDDGTMTIIALGLTGEETEADKQRLLEVFKVRETVGEQFCDDRWETWIAACDMMGSEPWSLQDFADRLHVAGWRPGMTAEGAARLLSEANNTRTE